MSNIIDKSSYDKHKIEKFEFRSISDVNESETFVEDDFISEETEDKKDTDQNRNDLSKEEPIPDIAELLKKIELLSETNVNLELKIENMQKEFNNELEIKTKEAYEKGKEDGIKETSKNLQDDTDELKTQLVNSVSNLNEKLTELEKYLDEIESELKDAAIVIAKKVIKKELEQDSNKIALSIAHSLIQDLKDATNIKLKVNPYDERYLIQHLSSDKKIKIEADDAVNKGGVIIISDIGNIDNNISTRLNKAISLIKEED